jgi:precorrin-2/cobalt-factor-2 C20-methyltransferase
MKVGRHLPKIRTVLDDLGLIDRAIYIERVGLANEHICNLADAPDNAPYFSMILLSKGEDPWL